MKTSWFSRSRSSSAPPPPPPPDAHPGCMAIMSYLIFTPGAGCVGRPPNSSHAAVVTTASPSSPGLQAPRNSLDLDAQIGVQIEPAFDTLARPRPSAPPSEAETPRTPSLVARLMGIDGLPDSPASSSTDPAAKPREKKKRVIPESISLRQPLRSLPDTPRASTSSVRPSAAPPTWDVVDHPRLSLQVLKDNVLDRARQYMSMPTSPTSLSKKKKTRSRRDAAAEGRSNKDNAVREIVRQARETVTNRKSKKNAAAAAIGKENASPVHHHQTGKENAPPAAKPMRAPLAEQQPHAPRLPLQPRPAPPPPPPQQQRAKPSRPPPPPPPLYPPPRAVATPAAAVKCKRPDGCERFATRIKKPAPPPLQAQPAPASSTGRDIVVYGERKITTTSAAEPATAVVPVEEDPEYVYLRTVLERGGFMRARTAARRPFKGHSVETPVDPLVFHLMELDLPADEARLGPLRHRWNRKLLFHLTQEMLAEQLLGLDPTSPSQQQWSGAALVARLWRRARSFPAANCRVVDDILALVAADVEAAGRARRVVERRLVAEEGEDVAEEVAERVLDALLEAEIAAVGGSTSPI
uniref:DUF4378 domain-containing protein n=1 Tax=Oryza punctata TaxID=4537 RepID=A0A0E0KM33_ORYPU